MGRGLVMLTRSGPSFWARAFVWGLAFAALVGVPTSLIENPLFTRMTAPTWWNYVVAALVAVMGGLCMAIRTHPAARECRVERRAAAGGGLAYVAVGCPLCNKAVVLALGSSGTLTYFAPAQVLLGASAVTVSFLILVRALRMVGRGGTRLFPDPDRMVQRA